ncbi:tetratricopeptide repeat protein 29 [Marchantia polymorpha subsp. ruderalis]|nr:hypothetical protein Mp_Vg00785 [Marchantia polymorpha subsp. ruderalis]
MEDHTTALVDLSSVISQQLLVDLLVGGTPRAYAEFFEITQVLKKDEKINEKEQLEKLKVSLSIIEITKCTGYSVKLFEAMSEVATIFEKAGDFHKSIFYYSNGLDIAERSGVDIQKAQVKFSLGKVYSILKSYVLAIQCFEEYIRLSFSNKNDEGIKEGANHLLQIYIKCADDAEQKNRLEESIQYHLKCIESASIGDNDKVVALTGHKIGLLHFRMHQPLISLEYQMKYLNICKLECDKVGESKAHTALAQIFESLGQVKEAIDHLEALLDVAKLMDRTTEARAYCRLGMIYAQHSQLDYAATYFERYYTTAWAMKDAKMLASAAINLGLTTCALPS